MKKTIEYFAAALLFFVFGTTFLQVILRTAAIPAVWSEELARMSFVVMTFIGTAALISVDGLIRVTILRDRLGKKGGAILTFITNLLSLPFIAVMVVGAFTNARLTWGDTSPTVEWLRTGYVYLAIALASCFMLWYQVVTLSIPVRTWVRRSPSGPEGAK